MFYHDCFIAHQIYLLLQNCASKCASLSFSIRLFISLCHWFHGFSSFFLSFALRYKMHLMLCYRHLLLKNRRILVCLKKRGTRRDDENNNVLCVTKDVYFFAQVVCMLLVVVIFTFIYHIQYYYLCYWMMYVMAIENSLTFALFRKVYAVKDYLKNIVLKNTVIQVTMHISKTKQTLYFQSFHYKWNKFHVWRLQYVLKMCFLHT